MTKSALALDIMICLSLLRTLSDGVEHSCRICSQPLKTGAIMKCLSAAMHSNTNCTKDGQGGPKRNFNLIEAKNV